MRPNNDNRIEEVGICSYCGRYLPLHPGRGRHVYHADCAHEARREQVKEAVLRFTNNLSPGVRAARRAAYNFIHRHGLSRREFLRGAGGVFLGSRLATWPVSRTAQQEEAMKTFQMLRTALIAGDRDFALDGALALQALLADDKSAFAFRVGTHCEELVRDAGEIVVGPSRSVYSSKNFRILENRSLLIEQRWGVCRDRLNQVRALLTHASLCRQYRRPSEAVSLINGAEHVLNGLCQDRSRKAVNMLLHQTLSWRFRLRAFDIRDLQKAEGEDELARLHDLAGVSGSPITRILTSRDEAAFKVLWDELAQAETILNEGRSRFQELPVYSAIADMSLRRSEIELSLRYNREKAARQVRELGRLWVKNPAEVQLNTLRTLEAKCGLKLPGPSNPVKIYSTPILAELWVDEELTAL